MSPPWRVSDVSVVRWHQTPALHGLRIFVSGRSHLRRLVGENVKETDDDGVGEIALVGATDSIESGSGSDL